MCMCLCQEPSNLSYRHPYITFEVFQSVPSHRLALHKGGIWEQPSETSLLEKSVDGGNFCSLKYLIVRYMVIS
uniref:Uncharacterized protein n=1 Tax=Arion vulgaris TaxID=1028688 RepID=A0A0B6YIL6_9EUPU